MADDSLRAKARSVFGKAFMDAVQPKPAAKNYATAQQQVANSRPIPTYKDGGAIRKDAVTEARAMNRAAAAGYKKGGKAKPMKKAEGGEASKWDEKLKRKQADIQKDYDKALAKGKNADIAKAKFEQRMADAKDDYAKWTGADRSSTRPAERAAEAALTMARRTQGANIANRDRPSTMQGREVSEVKAADVSVPKVGRIEKPAPARRSVSRKPAGSERVTTVVAKPAAAAAAAAPGITVTGRKALGDMKPAERAGAYRSAFQSGLATAAQEASAKANAPKLFEQRKANKLEALRMAAEAPGASRMAKDRYKFAKESGMIGSVEGYAVGGAAKVRKGCAPIKKGR